MKLSLRMRAYGRLSFGPAHFCLNLKHVPAKRVTEMSKLDCELRGDNILKRVKYSQQANIFPGLNCTLLMIKRVSIVPFI